MTIDFAPKSGTTFQNKILIAGKSATIKNGTIETNLNANFGSCGWSGGSGINPIPFSATDQVLKLTSGNWIYKCKTSSNGIYNSANWGKSHIHVFPNMYADWQGPVRFENGKIILIGTPPYPLQSGVTRFRFRNIKTLSPDSYYYDYPNKIQIQTTSKGPFYTSVGPRIINLSGVQNVKFIGVTFMGGSDGVSITNCSNITFENCKFIHIPRTALVISKSRQIDIIGCVFTDCGKGGIAINSCGNYENLTPADISIKNCTFKDCNMLVFSNSAYITAFGVGFVIESCNFYNSTGAAICLKANDTIINNCYFENCCSDCADFGIIYQGRSLTQRGLKISYCRFKLLGNSGASSGGSPKHAIYADDGYSGVDVNNCIFENVLAPNTCFFSFGRDHKISNCKTINVNIAFKSGPPRLPSGIAIPEYKALMANPKQKSLFIARYPELAIPIDFSKGFLSPKLQISNCKLLFNDIKGKSLDKLIIFNKAPESSQKNVQIQKI